MSICLKVQPAAVSVIKKIISFCNLSSKKKKVLFSFKANSVIGQPASLLNMDCRIPSASGKEEEPYYVKTPA